MCNIIRTYVLATSIAVTATRLTLAVGSLVSLLARSCRCWLTRAAMPKAYSDYTKQVVIYVPPPPGPRTGRYIAEIAAGGNQGNRTSQGRSQGSPGVEDRRNGPDRATERTVFRKTLSPCNANGTDRFQNIF